MSGHKKRKSYRKAYGFASGKRRADLLRRDTCLHDELPNPAAFFNIGNSMEEAYLHLTELSTLLNGYPRVTAMLYKIDDGKIEVIVVAQRPMTSPIQRILDTFSHRLNASSNSHKWVFTASPLPPNDTREYRSVPILLQ